MKKYFLDNNGFLALVKDALALAHAIKKFVMHLELMKKTGGRSREIVEERYDVNKASNDMLRTMRLI